MEINSTISKKVYFIGYAGIVIYIIMVVSKVIKDFSDTLIDAQMLDINPYVLAVGKELIYIMVLVVLVALVWLGLKFPKLYVDDESLINYKNQKADIKNTIKLKDIKKISYLGNFPLFFNKVFTFTTHEQDVSIRLKCYSEYKKVASFIYQRVKDNENVEICEEFIKIIMK